MGRVARAKKYRILFPFKNFGDLITPSGYYVHNTLIYVNCNFRVAILIAFQPDDRSMRSWKVSETLIKMKITNKHLFFCLGTIILNYLCKS